MNEKTGQVGRPRAYSKPEELIEKAEQYFKETPEEELTITGLCLYLNISKETFYEYAKREEFQDIVKMMQLKVENSYELSLRKYGRTGDIFALKNFGWRDKTEVEQSGESKLTISLQGDVGDWAK